MTIITLGPQETVKTRRATRAAEPVQPKLVEESIIVINGPPDTSTKGVDNGEADGFRSSTKTARTPEQEKAEPAAHNKDNHAPPNAPRPPARVKKFQPIDFTELKDDAEDMVKTKQPTMREPATREPTMHEPIEMLDAIKEMLASLLVIYSSEPAKSKILESITEVTDMLKEQ